jgi:hypothetical protein
MASKNSNSANPPRRWAPGDRLSFDKAIRNDRPDTGIPGQSKPVDDVHLSHPAHGQHPVTPTNHKPFNRQKKG